METKTIKKKKERKQHFLLSLILGVDFLSCPAYANKTNNCTIKKKQKKQHSFNQGAKIF